MIPRSSAIRETLELDFGGEEKVPAILQLPAGAEPVPAVLMLHGFTSRKERMANSIGQRLTTLGIINLAVDLPLHGARHGAAMVEAQWRHHPLALAQKWRLAVREAHAAIQFLAARPDVDPTRIAIAGYSLGAYLATFVAAHDELIRVVALASGGDLPQHIPFAPVVRTITGPRRAVHSLHGRPLLMVNGINDRIIAPAQARALFEAADEPKQLQWYDGGHWPTEAALTSIADWLALQLTAAAWPAIRR